MRKLFHRSEDRIRRKLTYCQELRGNWRAVDAFCFMIVVLAADSTRVASPMPLLPATSMTDSFFL